LTQKDLGGNSGSEDSEAEEEISSSNIANDVELSLTGASLGKIVLEEMKKLNLNLKLCFHRD